MPVRGRWSSAIRCAPMPLQGAAPRLEGLQIIWKQDPKVTGRGHFSHRLAFSPDGQYLFIGSGERQKFDPAQDMNSNLGKVLRLNDDGSVPNDSDAGSGGRGGFWGCRVRRAVQAAATRP